VEEWSDEGVAPRRKPRRMRKVVAWFLRREVNRRIRRKAHGARRTVGKILWYAMHLMVLAVAARWGAPGIVLGLLVLILIRTFLRLLDDALDDLARETALADDQADDEQWGEIRSTSTTWGPW
jgi:hypothetical protein